MSKRTKSGKKRASKRQKTGVDMSQYVKKSDIEPKYYTVNSSAALTANAGTTTSWNSAVILPTTESLNAPLVGGTNITRIGKKINIKTIRVHGQVFFPPDTSIGQGSTPIFRILLVCHKTCNGVNPNLAEIMSPNGVYAFQNIDHLGKYRILQDLTINFPPCGSTEGAVAGTFHTEGHGEQFKMTWKSKKGLDTYYNLGNTSGAGDVDQNNVFLICHCSQTAYSPLIAMVSRIKFIDL